MKKNNKNVKEKKLDFDKKVKNVEFAVSQIENNDFTMYFFILDSKNVPNATMCYIYQMAKALQDKGYKVCMLYQLEGEYTPEDLEIIKKEDGTPDPNRMFVGVGEWMGQEYAELPHMNIMREEWSTGPYDFLFIPEALSSLMFLTYKNKLNCQRYVILQDFSRVSEFIPLGQQWADYGVNHVIASCQEQADRINDVFPYTKPYTIVVPPYFPTYFRKPLMAKKMIINIITKDMNDVNRIVQPFYWKYPIYNFITFRDLRGYPRKEYAELLQEGQIVVWCDDKTPFGCSAVEAMKCGNLVIGKIPDIIPEWMTDDNGLWFNDMKDVPELIYKAVSTLLSDEMPEVLQKGIDAAEGLYSPEEYDKNLEKMMETIKSERINEFKCFLEFEKNNHKKEEE